MMKTSSPIKEAIFSIDLVGSKIEILHNNYNSIRTYTGSFLSMIILTFFIYSINYFGSDLMYREKPISQYGKEFSIEQIYLKDYPLKITVTDIYGKPVDYFNFLQIMGFNIRRKRCR
jgi:hypothetical protein